MNKHELETMEPSVANAQEQTVEIVVVGSVTRTVVVASAVTVGRDGDIAVDDERASRRHARLSPVPGGVLVEDLGSTNGTYVNGVRIGGPVMITASDRVRIGHRTHLRIVTPQPRVTGSHPDAAQGNVRSVPGTFAARYLATVEADYDLAASNLEPLRAVTGVPLPTVVLSDPFWDPADAAQRVASGSVVDLAAGEIWLVATPEQPPDSLARPLVVYLSAALPAAAELMPLLLGYAAWRSGELVPVDAMLADPWTPPLADIHDDRQVPLATAFVAHLVAQAGEEAFLRFVASAEPGSLDAAAVEHLGSPLGAHEQMWRELATSGASSPSIRGFARRSWPYVVPYGRHLALIFALAAVGLTFPVVLVKINQHVFNNVLRFDEEGRALRTFGDATVPLLLLGGALVVTLLARTAQEYASAKLSASIVRDIRSRVFRVLQDLPLGWHQSREQGDTMSRVLNDVASFEVGLSNLVRDGVIQSVSLVAYAVMLGVLNLQLAAITLIGAPLIIATYRILGDRVQKRSLQTREAEGRVSSTLAENLDAQHTVKSFGLERREQGRFGAALDHLFVSELRVNFFGGLFSVSMNLVISLLRITIMAYGIWLVLNGDLQIGTFVAFNGLLGEVITPMTQLADLGRVVHESSASLGRVEEVLSSARPADDPHRAVALPPGPGDIRLEQVWFGYDPDHLSLEGVDIHVPAGARVAIVGPSGSGKSTALALVQRLWNPLGGRVLIDGVDIAGTTVESLRDRIGLVAQDTFLFNGTIRDNIALAWADATDADILEAAYGAGLREFLAASPLGLDTPVGERGCLLSGGQRQRVAIARVLVRRPSILLLDEATSALDPMTEREVLEALQLASRGRTVITVTHRLDSVRDYDKIVVLARGRVIEQGTHDELLALQGLYHSMWNDKAQPVAAGAAHAARAGISPINGMAPEEFARFEAVGRRIHLEPGDRRREGGWLGIVLDGECDIEAPVGGTVSTIARMRTGGLFGVAALLGDPKGATLIATTPMEILELDTAALERLGPALESLLQMAGAGGGPRGGQRVGLGGARPAGR